MKKFAICTKLQGRRKVGRFENPGCTYQYKVFRRNRFCLLRNDLGKSGDARARAFPEVLIIKNNNNKRPLNT